MESDFTLGGREFKLRKLDPFKQLHIVRRISPFLSEALPGMKKSEKYTDEKEISKLSEKEKLSLIGEMIGPILNGASKLSDEDTEIVLFGLLSAIEMKQPAGNWAKVSTDKMLMIQDLELPEMLQLAGRSFMFNLNRFFNALPQPSQARGE